MFPSQIETVLLNHGYPANYQIIVDRVKSTDTLDVQVEMTPEMFTDNLGEIDRGRRSWWPACVPCWVWRQRSLWWRQVHCPQ